MQRLFEFIVRFKEYITLVLLIIMSFSFMTFGNVAKLGGFRALVIGTIGTVQSAFSWIPNPIALQSENSAMRDLNVQLSNEVVKMRRSVIENDKLRSMLDYKKSEYLPLLTAEVIGKTSTEARNYFTLNKGEADGVQDGMNVITDAGLVGIVISTSKHFCLVQIIINRDSRISSRIERTRSEGVLTWDGTEYLQMRNIPKSYDVQAGDNILSSELSNKYVKDIPIGTIIEVTSDGNSLFRKLKVKPHVNFSSLEHVFIILQTPNPERMKLEQELMKRIEKKFGRQ
ncbi:MAG: rod shape-determining protein MreC [Candidatus Kapabacteria bacterium]|nr:rod shape-determining protein MreC [Candidatus Kapabacteria bacterium]